MGEFIVLLKCVYVCPVLFYCIVRSFLQRYDSNGAEILVFVKF